MFFFFADLNNLLKKAKGKSGAGDGF